MATLLAGAAPASADLLDGSREPGRTMDLLSAAAEEQVVADAAGIFDDGAAAMDDVLAAGSTLGPGQSLVSASGRYALTLSEDGLLALVEAANRFTPEPIVLSVLAEGDPGATLVMQTDGNLVLYNPGGSVEVNFGTDGSGATQLAMQDDRNVVLYGPGGSVVLDFDLTTFSALQIGEVLLSGDRLVSEDGRTALVMQTDGNLVAYQDGGAVFASRTNRAGNAGAEAVMQADGNFVVYVGEQPVFTTATSNVDDEGNSLLLDVGEFSIIGGSEQPVALYGSAWRSPRVTSGQSLLPGDRRTLDPDGRYVLRFQTDGNIVQYADGRAVWQTGTAGRGAVYAAMQTDGNFVVYGGITHFGPLFQTRTAGNPGATLSFRANRPTSPVQVLSRTGGMIFNR